MVNIGFNKDVAWSHTVSTARRFTPYELKLGPATRRATSSTAAPSRCAAAPSPGARRRRLHERHTFYETRWGPVFDYPPAAADLDAEHAYALADVNADNFRLTNQWAEYDIAQSVDGLAGASARSRATRGST